jgi:DNA-binding transcriptional LysR family regulator
MDKLRALETFVAIADAGSLTKASIAPSTSTPTVARSLAALEASLSVRLFARTTRRIALTHEGRAYLEKARAVLAAVDDADAAVSAVDDEPRGRVVLTAPVLFGQMVVAPIVTRFVQQHPQMSVGMQLFDRVVDLVDEGVDVGVRIGALTDSSLVASTVGRVRRVVVASPAYLKKHGTPTTPKALLAHNCLGFTATTTGPWWTFRDPKSGRDLHVPVRGNLDFNHAAPAVDACAAGVGVGMFISYQAAPLLFARKLVLLLERFEPPPRPVSVVVPSNRLLPLRTRALVDTLKRELKDLPSPFARSQ